MLAYSLAAVPPAAEIARSSTKRNIYRHGYADMKPLMQFGFKQMPMSIVLRDIAGDYHRLGQAASSISLASL